MDAKRNSPENAACSGSSEQMGTGAALEQNPPCCNTEEEGWPLQEAEGRDGAACCSAWEGMQPNAVWGRRAGKQRCYPAFLQRWVEGWRMCFHRSLSSRCILRYSFTVLSFYCSIGWLREDPGSTPGTASYRDCKSEGSLCVYIWWPGNSSWCLPKRQDKPVF